MGWGPVLFCTLSLCTAIALRRAGKIAASDVFVIAAFFMGIAAVIEAFL